MRSRYLLIGLIGAVLLVGFVISRLDGSRSTSIGDPKHGGPLREPNGHGSAMNVDVGATWTDAYETLAVGGDSPGKILDIESVGTSRGLEYLGADVAPKRTGPVPQVFRRWPAPDRVWLGQTEPAQGATIPTQSDGGWPLLLLLGYRVERDGRLTREGIRITYEVNGERYVQTFEATWVVCGPSARNERGVCPIGRGGG